MNGKTEMTHMITEKSNMNGKMKNSNVDAGKNGGIQDDFSDSIQKNLAALDQMDGTVQYIRDLSEGNEVNTWFVVRTKNTPREYRNKPGRYFFLGVGDSSGEMAVKYWGDGNAAATMQLYNSLSIGDTLHVTGLVQKDRYDGSLGITVTEGTHTMSRLTERVNKELVPRATASADDLGDQIKSRIAQVKSRDEPLGKVLEAQFEDEPFMKSFLESPATALTHHAYLGGLAEHTLNVASTCEMFASMYPLDAPLLITAALLHDVGRVGVYSTDPGFEMTDDGQFLGHVHETISRVRRACATAGLAPQRTLLLLHCIAYHHGTSDGAPGNARIPEVMALYLADNADIANGEFQAALAEVAPVEDRWVYSRRAGTVILNTSGKKING